MLFKLVTLYIIQYCEKTFTIEKYIIKQQRNLICFIVNILKQCFTLEESIGHGKSDQMLRYDIVPIGTSVTLVFRQQVISAFSNIICNPTKHCM